MEFIVVIVAGLIGWKHRTFGRRELKGLLLVVVGWSAVTTAAAVPYLSLEGVLLDLFYHAVVVAVPFGLGVLLGRLAERRR